MKKTLLPILLIVSLSLFGCGDGVDDVDGAISETDYSDSVLQDFLDGDVEDANIICHQSTPVMDSELEVITYISGSKIRIEYMMIPPIQGQEDMYIVSDGVYMYMWGNSFLGKTMSGFKVAIGSEGVEVPEEDLSDLLDYDMPMVDCVSWDPDSSYFEIPSDVSFMDMADLESSMMESYGLGEGGGLDGAGVFEVDCSICDQMPASERPSCLEAMGCE